MDEWADDPSLSFEDRHRIAEAARKELEFIIHSWQEERKDMVSSIAFLTASVATLKETIESRDKTIDALNTSVTALNSVLSTGKGTLELLFLLARISGAIAVIFGSAVAVVYGIRKIG